MKRLLSRLGHIYFYDIKLRRKLLISHLLLIILPTFVLALFLNTQLYDIIVSDTVLSEQTLAVQTTNAIESNVSQVIQASDSFAQSEAVMQFFSEENPDSDSEEGTTGEDMDPDADGSGFSSDAGSDADLTGSDPAETLISGETAQETSGLLNNILVMEQLSESLTDGDLITGIQFYLDDSYRTILGDSETTLFSPLSEVKATYWYGIFSSTDSSSMFCPASYLSVTEEETYGSLAYICRLNAATGEEVYLAVYFSGEELASVLSDNVTTDNSATYIINERDEIVSSSSSALSGAYYMSNEELEELTGGVNLYTTRSYREDSIYVGYYEIEGTQWHLVSILSSESLTRKGNLLVLQFVAIYLIFFVLALIIAILLSRSIANRIVSLSGQMQNVHHQTPVRIETDDDAHDEIGDLLNTYNYMSDEINDLLEQQKQAAEDLKRQEFRALQAQINPHFLYNSLDMINWLSRSGKQEDVTRMVQALSRFYKLSLSRSDSQGTVALELEHVSLYVQIQNMRFEDRITFIIDVPDTMMDYEMPRLILQPIVENSILHGILEKPGEPGLILITGWIEEGDIVLQVSDDGVGMTKEQMETILTDRGTSKTGSHIGISNTHSRLQLLYGERYGLHYESEPGRGTDTRVRLPALLPAEPDT